MPLTDFQRDVFRLLASHRHPDSYVAGATPLHRQADSPRFSEDIDIFHDAEEAVARAAENDLRVLAENGYQIERTLITPAFQRAGIRKQNEVLKLEWAVDSAFRFFPVQPDDDFGFTLHIADLATNKILALAGRWEARDFIDTLYLHRTYAQLGLLAWAAAGKDPGLTPLFILEQAARFNRLNADELAAVLGSGKLDLPKMKADWLRMLDSAQRIIRSLPTEDMGCFYLGPGNTAVDPGSHPNATRHFASVGGALPHVAHSSVPLPQRQSERAASEARDRYQK
ncbi:MAG: nucleotidyl transferase AbiEii/AbiGii toxin family protein [Verrucomicrobiota bacterium]|nr:nucleotidyl transferase AbiEii/AbiGii toxin family protein [Verrucomicrobiota bacterium]